jgi:hypothetical protein
MSRKDNEINVDMAEIMKELCPKCQEKIKQLIAKKITDKIFAK